MYDYFERYEQPCFHAVACTKDEHHPVVIYYDGEKLAPEVYVSTGRELVKADECFIEIDSSELLVERKRKMFVVINSERIECSPYNRMFNGTIRIDELRSQFKPLKDIPECDLMEVLEL